MPRFEVTAPDGGRYEVTAPEGASEQDAINYVQSQMAPQAAPQMAPANPAVQMIQNIPQSAINFAGGIGQAIAHPINTAMGLWDAAAGGLHNLLPQSVTNPIDQALPSPATQRAVDTANAVGQFYKNRYGGMQNLQNTIVQDPVGFLADVSAVAGGAGGIMKAAGIPGASVPLTVSEYTNPLNLAYKGVTAVGKPIYKFAAGMTSGAGPEAVGEALKGSPNYVSAMRGTMSEDDIYQQAQDSLQAIKDARAKAYTDQLAKVKAANQEIDLAPIQNQADRWLRQYNVRVTPDGLDFSRSTLTGKAASEVEEVYNMVKGWGSEAGDNTPAMLDVLKRRLNDYYASERNSRAMVTSLANTTKQQIVNAVPEYADMTQGYAEASDTINDVQKALALNDRSGTDVALRKMMTALRQDRTFRRAVITSLDQQTNKDLMGSLAGLMLKPGASMRLGSMMTGFGGALAMLSHPGMAAAIPLASPRVVGELSLLLSKFGKAEPYAAGAGVGAFEANQMNQGDNNGND